MGAYTEIVDFTFTANETSRTFSGLSITKDDFIKVIVTHINNTNSNNFIRLFPNTSAGVAGNETNSNYTLQVLVGDGSTISAVRGSFNELTFTQNTTSQTIAYIKISENNKFNIFANCNGDIGNNVFNRFVYTTSHNLTFNDPITSLTFRANETNSIATGSRIQIYKLAAEKVADITVASNTTQVDISNLSIDKDSEYLLVSDLQLIGGPNIVNLFVNSNFTDSNYHSQLITGSGSTASAARQNFARYSGGGTNSSLHNIIYSHIKLSNIGAYTSQNYNLQRVGTSEVTVQNAFVSSTAENITTINSLRITGTGGSPTIVAGSRFILYKLYE